LGRKLEKKKAGEYGVPEGTGKGTEQGSGGKKKKTNRPTKGRGDLTSDAEPGQDKGPNRVKRGDQVGRGTSGIG